MECDSGAREGIVGEGMKDGFDENALHASTKCSNNRIIIKVSLAALVSCILSWCKECCCAFLMLFFFIWDKVSLRVASHLDLLLIKYLEVVYKF